MHIIHYYFIIRLVIQALMNVGYMHTPYNYLDCSSKGPHFLQKEPPLRIFWLQACYGNYRYHSHYPWSQKNLKSCIPHMQRAEREDQVSVQATIAKETGFTGLSILHRLYHLYGFNVLTDTVFDAMYNLPLNVGLHHMNYYFDEEIINKQEVDQRLNVIPWTTGTLVYTERLSCTYIDIFTYHKHVSYNIKICHMYIAMCVHVHTCVYIACIHDFIVRKYIRTKGWKSSRRS